MALKGDRQIDATEITYFLNEVAERGSIVSINTAGSGISLENSKSVATVLTNPSGGKPLGLLLNDFVSIDRTRFPINWHKDQAASGDKASILTKGWVVTNKLLGTVTAGQVAYLAESGNLRGSTLPPANLSLQPVVGRFRSDKDEAGYAKVYVDL